MNIRKFNRFVEIAKALTFIDSNLRCRHITFIVKKGKIVSIGKNNSKTNTKNLKFNYCGKDGKDLRKHVGTHSEMSAIIKYGRESCDDCVFVNVRLDKYGNLMQSKCCSGCFSLLQQVGFKKFYYSSENGFKTLSNE